MTKKLVDEDITIMPRKEIVLMRIAVHPVKAKLWRLGTSGQIETSHTLRKIGSMIGEEHPQKIKHHLDEMVKMGAINYVDGGYQFPVI